MKDREDGNTGTMLACGVLLACGLAPLPARAEDRVQAASPWNVDWGSELCTLQRQFGTGGDRFLLRMNSYGPGYSFEFYLSGESLRLFRKRMPQEIAFGPHAPIEISMPQPADNDTLGPGVIFSLNMREGPTGREENEEGEGVVPSPYPDKPFEQGIDRITLSAGDRALTLETGPMPAPLAALRKCTDSMVARWGLDPAVQATLTRPAKSADLRSLARDIQKNYPEREASRGKQARVNVRVLVDAEGRVTGCAVPASYNDPAFDELACKSIRRSRFDPALDANGNPVASYWNTTVTYWLN